MGGVDSDIGFQCRNCNHQQIEFMEQADMDLGMEFDDPDVWKCKKCKSGKLTVILVQKRW